MNDKSKNDEQADTIAPPVERLVMRDPIPPKWGLYVAYVKPEFDVPFAEKKLLMWIDGKWGYPGSDQNFRSEVVGWIGPLPPLRLDV